LKSKTPEVVVALIELVSTSLSIRVELLMHIQVLALAFFLPLATVPIKELIDVAADKIIL
jgi:hypothetical protein